MLATEEEIDYQATMILYNEAVGQQFAERMGTEYLKATVNNNWVEAGRIFGTVCDKLAGDYNVFFCQLFWNRFNKKAGGN